MRHTQKLKPTLTFSATVKLGKVFELVDVLVVMSVYCSLYAAALVNLEWHRNSLMALILRGQRPRHAIRYRRKRAMRARFSSVLWLLGQSSNSAGPGEIRRSLALNRSTRDSYTRCHGNTDIARLRMLPVCRWCVA